VIPVIVVRSVGNGALLLKEEPLKMTEEELNKICTPDDVCKLDSMFAAKKRLDSLGFPPDFKPGTYLPLLPVSVNRTNPSC